jgi:hypothetical protein
LDKPWFCCLTGMDAIFCEVSEAGVFFSEPQCFEK